MSDRLSDQLVDFAIGLRFEDLPSEVVREAVRRWIDSVGCAVGALEEPAPTYARTAARKLASNDAGSSLIAGGKAVPDWAAFSNGVHIRYLDCNDTYLSLEPAHPSDNWAAVFAAGEQVGASGRDLIVGAVLAYEVQCRLCDAASIRARGWDHVTYGALSSSLAASKLLGLDREAMTHALGIAGTTSPALRLTRAGELSMWKGCAFANAARIGVFSALLAREGLTGPAPLFEGDMGFFQQVSGPFSIEKLGGKAREDWMLPKTSIKFVPAEYHSQSAIAAAFELRDQVGDAHKIRSIEIRTFRAAVEIIGKDPEKWRPRTRETADHSLPYCTAVALMDGEITARQFTPERLNDSRLLDLVARTKVIEDPELTALYPEGIPNHLRIELDDGRVLERRLSYPPGHDKNPLSDEQLRTKFRGLVEPVLGEEAGNRLYEKASRLDQDPSPASILSEMRLV